MRHLESVQDVQEKQCPCNAAKGNHGRSVRDYEPYGFNTKNCKNKKQATK